MIFDVKYDAFRNQIVCKDLETGIVGKVIKVHNPAEASRVMNELDTKPIIEHINEIKLHMQKGEVK